LIGCGILFRKIRGLFILLISIVFLVSCDLDGLLNDENIENNDSSVTTISELENTNHFQAGALEHILEGELNGRGQAVGFHYDGLPTKKGEIISGTETVPNSDGVYEAKVEVSSVSKTSNGGKSSFFPKEWNAQQVVDAINEAYDTRTFITGNTYEGLTSEAMIIRMYLNQDDKIISAFPLY
jgi:hypothetical protein